MSYDSWLDSADPLLFAEEFPGLTDDESLFRIIEQYAAMEEDDDPPLAPRLTSFHLRRIRLAEPVFVRQCLFCKTVISWQRSGLGYCGGCRFEMGVAA